MGKRYLTMILLIARLSMHIRQVPSFLGVRSAGTAHGLEALPNETLVQEVLNLSLQL